MVAGAECENELGDEGVEIERCKGLDVSLMQDKLEQRKEMDKERASLC